MSPTIIIIISAVISTCISKIMAEYYLRETLDMIDKMLKDADEKTKEYTRLITEALDRRPGLK